MKPFVPMRKSDSTLHLLSTVDLIGSSQIQHVLLCPSFWEARESPLSVQHLFQALQELFQRAREEPGRVHPGAAELTLSLLMAMYDRWGCRGHTVTSRAGFGCHWSSTIWCCLMFVYGLMYKMASLFSTHVLLTQEGNEEDTFIRFTNISDPWLAKREKIHLTFSHKNSFLL